MINNSASQPRYPHNLLQELYGTSSEDTPPKLSADIIAGINYAISTLPDVSRELIRLYYAESRAFTEIADILAIPADQLSLLLHKTLKKLRSPTHWNYIQYGIAGWLKKETERCYNKGYHLGYTEGYKNGIEDSHAITIAPSTESDASNLPIEALNLSARAYNVLSRAGFTLVRDIVPLRQDAIFAMRSLGAISAREIATALQVLGIQHTDWYNFL